ncbi:hypothetical protein CU669_02795 [Paramagnetospirillum kuznetsovii]|uniref:ABC-type transport auxiliary lipoprotein component domain-containing protein n=2 Tax=Paramagnetospirillum kuznetsovii TaxID=2053833 RepID=A0A364P184_9PROT|nr:hypothetical protein CU669_02795 [Paramagnetospirillum kuznetsovii]
MVAAFFLLTACGDIPQPFRHEGLNHAVAPSAGRGIVVRPLDDSARSVQLAEAVVRKLLEVEIPASTRPVVAGAWVIAAQAEPGPTATALHWTLTRSDGEELGGVDQSIPAGPWGRATPRTLDLIAAEVVDKLSGALTGGAMGKAEAAPVTAGPTVQLLALGGLPGDGDKALWAAMRRMLDSGGLRLVEGEADFRVRGQVTVSPGTPGEEILAVAWTVMGRDGQALGTAAQQGGVPKGRLSGAWGGLASDIAAGGADGVMEIIRAAFGK